MAAITRENIGLLNDKISLKIEKTDYLPAFDKALKEYSKKANIPGFRKGMVPAGLIKKMYGASVYTDEIMRTIDRELMKYMETEKLEIFAQPIPMDINLRQLDMNSPADYNFDFEIGLKPEFSLSNLSKGKFIRYKVKVTEEMIDSEVARQQNRFGNMKDCETVTEEENVLNVSFAESDADGNESEGGAKKDNSLLLKYFSEKTRKNLMGKKAGDSIVIRLKSAFEDKEREWVMDDLGLDKTSAADAEKYFKLTISKVGLLEKKELNEEFFKQLYPAGDVVTEADFRNKLKSEIEAYWDSQARNQIQDQIYHNLVDQTEIPFPEAFLKKWIKTQGETPKTDEEVEKEFPAFLNQLKWTLITDKVTTENGIQVGPDEIRAFAKQQLMGYMGGAAMDENQPWIKDYVEKMMKDKKYVEESYNRIQAQKIFEWAESQVKATEKPMSMEDFTKMVEEHQHHHH